jgi:hypothetical protein
VREDRVVPRHAQVIDARGKHAFQTAQADGVAVEIIVVDVNEHARLIPECDLGIELESLGRGAGAERDQLTRRPRHADVERDAQVAPWLTLVEDAVVVAVKLHIAVIGDAVPVAVWIELVVAQVAVAVFEEQAAHVGVGDVLPPAQTQ